MSWLAKFVHFGFLVTWDLQVCGNLSVLLGARLSGYQVLKLCSSCRILDDLLLIAVVDILGPAYPLLMMRQFSNGGLVTVFCLDSQPQNHCG